MRLWFVNIKRESGEDVNHYMLGETEPTREEILADTAENKDFHPQEGDKFEINVTDNGEWQRDEQNIGIS